MRVATPHVNRLGHTFYKEGMRYMCGMKLRTDSDYPGYPDYTAYWTTDPSEAISVFDLCKIWKSVAAVYDSSCPVNTEILIGCTSDLETCRPYCVQAVGATLYLTYQGLSHQEAGWDEVTPEWLYDWAAPAKPVLKEQSACEWAFTVGTLSRVGVVAPNWSVLLCNSGYLWVARKLGTSYLTEGLLSDYFYLGTNCKVGTPFNLVRYIDGKATLSTTPVRNIGGQQCTGVKALTALTP